MKGVKLELIVVVNVDDILMACKGTWTMEQFKEDRVNTFSIKYFGEEK